MLLQISITDFFCLSADHPTARMYGYQIYSCKDIQQLIGNTIKKFRISGLFSVSDPVHF